MDAMQYARLVELAGRAAYTGQPQFSRFIEPSEPDDARRAANERGVHVCFYGGYENAERVIAAFFDWEAPDNDAFPIIPLKLSWNEKYASPGHRDLLGALMGLGVERACTGDIAMASAGEKPCAVLYALPEIADYLCANFESAGRASVKAAPLTEPVELSGPEGVRMRCTVQNARLDAVLAAGYRLSRSEAQKLISQGLVKLNHVPCLKPDSRLDEGDLLSAKGYGRLKIEGFEGETRKGRLAVRLFRYGNSK